jgi:hypothetical protein
MRKVIELVFGEEWHFMCVLGHRFAVRSRMKPPKLIEDRGEHCSYRAARREIRCSATLDRFHRDERPLASAGAASVP